MISMERELLQTFTTLFPCQKPENSIFGHFWPFFTICACSWTTPWSHLFIETSVINMRLTVLQRGPAYASSMQHWPVSKRTPSHKSIGCRKSEDVVGLVEGRGTLRLTAEAILWVHRIFKGGLSHPSFRQKRRKRQRWLISLKKSSFPWKSFSAMLWMD